MKNVRKIIVLVLAFALALSSFTGCGKENEEPVVTEPVIEEPEEPAAEPEPVVEPVAEPEPVVEPEPEPVYEGPYNPYTGLPCEEDISGVRPYAVMINNIKVATPQWGITAADIMYEVLVEGGLTRLMAIYSNLTSVDCIGSIRSSRPYYLDILQGYDAIYIHAGGSEDAYSQISKRGINNIDGVRGSGVTFHRDAWRKANMGTEHSLMLDTLKVPDFVEKAKWRTDIGDSYRNILSFTDEAKPEGDSAVKIHVMYSKSKTTDFEYNEEDKLYYVFQYGSKMWDETQEKQMNCKNVLVLYTEMSKIAGDDKGRMKGTFYGEGNGMFFCEGSCVPIKWSKASATDPYKYTLEDGSQLELGRGVTYIPIVAPSYGEVSYE